MKYMLMASFFFSSFSASAATFETQDNIYYIVTLADILSQADTLQCVADIKAVSRKGHPFQHMRILGVVSANLSTYAAQKVSQMRCVLAVEEDQIVEAQPRVGRQN